MSEFRQFSIRKIFEYFYVFESMRRVKRYVILTALVMPTMVLGWNLFIEVLMSNKTWIDPSNQNKIQIMWIFTVPISAFILILAEAFAEKLKKYRYYYCTTFCIYESIGVFSFFTYINATKNLWSIENYIHIDSAKHSIHIYFIGDNVWRTMNRLMILLSILSTGYIYFIHWTKNMFVHISVCRYEVYGHKPKTNQYDEPFEMYSARFVCLSTLMMFIVITAFLSVWSAILFITLIHYTMFLTISHEWIQSWNFLQKSMFDMILWILLCLILITTNVYKPWVGKTDDDFVHIGLPDLILCWICFLTIARQWFLDIVTCPEKYTDKTSAKD